MYILLLLHVQSASRRLESLTARSLDMGIQLTKHYGRRFYTEDVKKEKESELRRRRVRCNQFGGFLSRHPIGLEYGFEL